MTQNKKKAITWVYIPKWVKDAGLEEDYRDSVMQFNVAYATQLCKGLIKEMNYV